MHYRPRWSLILLGALVVAVLFTYPTWRKFLTGKGSTVAFPAASEGQREIFAQMSKDNHDAAATAYVAMLTVVPAPTNEQPTPVLPDAQVILSGNFIQIDAVHVAQGAVTVYRRADSSLILRFDDFNVTNAPDLSVYLASVSAPKIHDDMGSGGKPEFKVGPLKGSTGNQQFNLPKELQISAYKSVVIFSESLNTIYSTAPLR